MQSLCYAVIYGNKLKRVKVKKKKKFTYVRSKDFHKIKHVSDDILHQMRISTSNPYMEMSEEISNEALILIEDMWLGVYQQGINSIMNEITQPPNTRRI